MAFLAGSELTRVKRSMRHGGHEVTTSEYDLPGEDRLRDRGTRAVEIGGMLFLQRDTTAPSIMRHIHDQHEKKAHGVDDLYSHLSFCFVALSPGRRQEIGNLGVEGDRKVSQQQSTPQTTPIQIPQPMSCECMRMQSKTNAKSRRGE